MTRAFHVFVSTMVAAALALALAQTELEVSSEALAGGTFPARYVYRGFGCAGGNVSPDLSWSGAPSGTRSFAVTMFDPDAPTGHGWWHWILYDIPAHLTGLPENAGAPGDGGTPAGAVHGPTDFSTPGYGGPCPPAGSGPHRYEITVYALDVPSLGVGDGARPVQIRDRLEAHALARGGLTVPYQR
jgi:hypothetical protein